MAQILATVCLRRATYSYSEHTGRDALRYHSRIDSMTGADVLPINIFTNASATILPPGTWVTIMGIMNEGSKGATADIEVQDGDLKVVDPSHIGLGTARIVVTGRIHQKYLRTDSCLIIETSDLERKWFYALPMHHFRSHTFDSLRIGDIIKVTSQFGGLFHSTDDCGLLIELIPLKLSATRRLEITHHYPINASRSIGDESDNDLEPVFRPEGQEQSGNVLTEAVGSSDSDSDSTDGEGDIANRERSEDPASDAILRAAATARQYEMKIRGRMSGEDYSDEDFSDEDTRILGIDILGNCGAKQMTSSSDEAADMGDIDGAGVGGCRSAAHGYSDSGAAYMSKESQVRQFDYINHTQAIDLPTHSSPIAPRTLKRPHKGDGSTSDEPLKTKRR